MPDLLTLWLALQLRASLFTSVCWNLIIAHYFVGNNLKDWQNTDKYWEKIAYTFLNRSNLLFCGWSQTFSGPRFIHRYIRNRALARSVIARVQCIYLYTWCFWVYFLFQSGLSTMLNAIRVFDTTYHSLGVDFRPICMVSLIILCTIVRKHNRHCLTIVGQVC